MPAGLRKALILTSAGIVVGARAARPRTRATSRTISAAARRAAQRPDHDACALQRHAPRCGSRFVADKAGPCSHSAPKSSGVASRAPALRSARDPGKAAGRSGRLSMIKFRTERIGLRRGARRSLAASASARPCCRTGREAQNEERAGAAFEVDPFWPKPIERQLLGSTIGVWVDEQDHVWIIHRSSATLHNNEKGAELNPPIAECCRGAPPVLVFDPEGNLVRSWGGPGDGYEWPQSNHGIHVDYKGNVWIGGNGEKDAQILKFTKDGKFLLQVGALRQERRQQRSGELRPRRQDLGRSEDQRGLPRRRLPQQARGGDRRRHRQDEALLGRLRQQAGRRQARPLRPEGAAGAAVPQPGALRRARRTTG